jgi:hypothetical protein
MTNHPHAATSKRWLAVAMATVLFAISLTGWAASQRGKKDKPTSAKATPHAAAQTTENETPPAKADTVRISIQTSPSRKAMVKWGRKTLGVIPTPRALVVERPRDSGPLDLVIYAGGYMTVHTRAYTFSDQHVAVKLTPPSEKNKLFGYREEPAPNPDAGAPAAEPAKP